MFALGQMLLDIIDRLWPGLQVFTMVTQVARMAVSGGLLVMAYEYMPREALVCALQRSL